MQTSKRAPHGRRAGLFISLISIFLAFTCLFIYTWQRVYNPSPVPVSQAEADLSRTVYFTSLSPVNGARSFSDAPDLFSFQAMPEGSAFSGFINARSAILADASTGSVLFEKNADEIIPPASMTKLVAMYTAFHAAENGEITFDDVVALPKETWAVNIPSGSSLMFLAEGQKVTVRELLSGMAVASGNDAALALALHVSPALDVFIARMNGEMERLGLPNTRFVEPSGLSGENKTTSREFADFSLRYIREYPEALRAFHAQTTIEYPMPWNTPGRTDTRAVVQSATNKLLGVLEGCDGLKTGYINESGYNISLTCERNGTRYIAVTMGGPGSGSYEGNLLRSEDGTALMEWAFANFRTVKSEEIKPFPMTVWGGTDDSMDAIPAGMASFTAPVSVELTDGKGSGMKTEIFLPSRIWAPVAAGTVVGRVDYTAGGKALHSVPLIAGRSIARGNALHVLIDTAASLVSPLAGNKSRYR